MKIPTCVSFFRIYEGGRKKVIEEEWLSYIENFTNTKEPSSSKKDNPQQRRSRPDVEEKPPEQANGDHDSSKARVRKGKQNTEAAEFFWKNTGLLNTDTCEAFREDSNTSDKDRDDAVPQCIAVCQARITENMQEVFKKAVAQDPGNFVLGDKDYWEAAKDGNYSNILHTYTKFKRRGRRRINGEVYLDSKVEEEEEEEPKK